MPMDISIPSTSVSSSTDKPFTIYTIRIQQPIRTITVAKRYSDFVQLHADLTAQSGGAPPPAPLPSKSWWFTRTVNNPAMTEQRRRGLEAYLRAVEAADDGRWRHTSAWRTFLQLGTTMRSSPYSENGGANGVNSTGGGHWEPGRGGAVGIRDPATWLAVHQELKGNLHQARLALTRREQAQTAQQQHEAGAAAKKYLVLAGTLISALDDGLRRLSGNGGGNNRNGRAGGAADYVGDAPVEKLGEGELRRRRDLLSGARKEKEGLEGVLGAMAVKSLAAGGSGAGAPASAGAAATPADKAHLFRGMNGANGNGAVSKRTLGAKETTRTRELDNQGVLQLQRQIMQEQDEDVADLSTAVRRMREMGIQINDELQLQNEMLRMLDDDVDRVDSKVRVAKKRIDKIR
ncbi:putative snare complex subunit protein [Lasiodiplodia theobromae]|uniref:Putative syntaxin-8B n=1 Tax=Lasiodiplodia theobromae TaxID=45133 RepID=A0A5N5D2C4_9PEZI|nr:Snare complex subunit [Lasiodiplodia theobromae]KAB2571796.1 putative syntaxin-8B [Lasiodiplodia theobromae]KAF4539742.1 Snare complex subunit [Lasiodiplodia theobromae]KAF9636784.1 putative snare complex subunit protein [Lasiodiplodia theobromae]